MKEDARVLVIDDEESIRLTLSSFLSDAGYKVKTAKNYEEAIAEIDANEPDIIFADIILGGKSGIDILRATREKNMRCPVVMLTGYPNIETASEAVRFGAFEYISKPIRKNDILHIAQLALRFKTISDRNEKYRSNLEAIFRSVKDAIIMVDRDLAIAEINDAAMSICHFSQGDISKSFESLSADCSLKCLEALRETIASKKSVEMQRIECRLSNRESQLATITTAPLIDSHETFTGAVIVVRDETRLAILERTLQEKQRFHNIIGRSQKMLEIYSLIEDLADVRTTVLITGESGTGKELVAEALHYKGERRLKPFIKVNCTALSETLLESELFGHVKGAFTGAITDRAGRFQKADGGTIFLDEIGDISQKMQVQLLRVLQEMEIERVGDSTPIKIDVRVIAATNRNLPEKVKRGEFREDLYYRLKVVEIPLPPLRDRFEDIPLLADHFIEKFNTKLHKDIKGISDDVGRIFMEYKWPGNIRELEHLLEHAFIRCRQSIITLAHLPQDFRDSVSTDVYDEKTCDEDEIQAIRAALEKTAGNKAKAARLLEVDRKTLYRKLEKFKILQE